MFQIGNKRVAKALVSSGAAVDKPNNKNLNERPLHLAVMNGRFKMVKFLVKHGANVNAEYMHSVGPKR